MLLENHYASKEITEQKEYLDRVCRSFASRMERRRDVILVSYRFHKNAAEVWTFKYAGRHRGFSDFVKKKITLGFRILFFLLIFIPPCNSTCFFPTFHHQSNTHIATPLRTQPFEGLTADVFQQHYNVITPIRL